MIFLCVDFLEEYLSIVRESKILIMICFIHLQALSCSSKVSNESLLKVYLRLALSYQELGFSGRSGIMLSVSRPICSAVDAYMKSEFDLVYGLYLNSIGNTQKCLQVQSEMDQTDSIMLARFLLLSSHTSSKNVFKN